MHDIMKLIHISTRLDLQENKTFDTSNNYRHTFGWLGLLLGLSRSLGRMRFRFRFGLSRRLFDHRCGHGMLLKLRMFFQQCGIHGGLICL